MRMWMVPPFILCRKHLLGEHVECHMFRSALYHNHKLEKFVENNLFQPLQLKERHDILAQYMRYRHYNHKSPMEPIDKNILFNLPIEYIMAKVDVQASIEDLINRCPDCRDQYRRGKMC